VVCLPLSPSICLQVSLYLLLMEERYGETLDEGLLWYLPQQQPELVRKAQQEVRGLTHCPCAGRSICLSKRVSSQSWSAKRSSALRIAPTSVGLSVEEGHVKPRPMCSPRRRVCLAVCLSVKALLERTLDVSLLARCCGVLAR
jgi:hypothetical protein